VLHGKLSLHDIDDVEAFSAYLIDRQRRGGYTGHNYEDLLSWFIESTWELSLRYDPERGSSFRNFCASKLRVASWERVHFGRTVWKFRTHVYERPRPTFVPYDNQLGLADPASTGGSAADSIQTVLGLQRTGGSKGDGSNTDVGEG